jgi:hypothetical protein
MKAVSVQDRTTQINIYSEVCFMKKDIKTAIDHCHPRVRKSLIVNEIKMPSQNKPAIAMI